jgi:hypothetical protein
MSGHTSARNQTCIWLTPPPVLRALGPFDLDPCACSEPRPWATAAHHFTAEDNGLDREWFGRVWLNPPYGGPKILRPWLDRMAEHNHGTAIIFARTETDAFFECGWARATAALFLRGRLVFHRPDGVAAEHNGGAPSVLLAYGDADAERLANSGLSGAFVDLRNGCRVLPQMPETDLGDLL